MALSTERLQQMLDELDVAIASAETEVTTSDGKHTKFDDLNGLLRRRAAIVRLLGGGAKNRVLLLRLRDAR